MWTKNFFRRKDKKKWSGIQRRKLPFDWNGAPNKMMTSKKYIVLVPIMFFFMLASDYNRFRQIRRNFESQDQSKDFYLIFFSSSRIVTVNPAWFFRIGSYKWTSCWKRWWWWWRQWWWWWMEVILKYNLNL